MRSRNSVTTKNETHSDFVIRNLNIIDRETDIRIDNFYDATNSVNVWSLQTVILEYLWLQKCAC